MSDNFYDGGRYMREYPDDLPEGLSDEEAERWMECREWDDEAEDADRRYDEAQDDALGI